MSPGDMHEINRCLVVRDLAAAARHAIALHEDSDGIELHVTFNRDGMSLDVTHTAQGIPVSGWGQ